MNKRNKIWMISGAVLAAILISAAAFSSIKARKSSPNSIDDNSIDNRMLEAAQEEMPEDTLNTLSTDEAAAEDSWEITDEITSEIEALIQKYYTVEDLNEEVLVSDTEKDTYIAFTTYKTRFINIETLAPGMSVLYIVPNEEGKLGVQDLPKDKNLEEHINDLLAEKEIAAMVEKVNAGFSKAIDKDENLKTFVEKLSEEAKQGSQKNKK